MIPDPEHAHRTRLVATAALIVTFLAAFLPVAVVNAASPYILTFNTEPGSSSGQGLALNPQPVVHVTDGSLVAQAGVSVSLAISPGTGTSGANLSCASLSVATDASGNATFSSCSIDQAGSGYELVAEEPLGAGVISSAFNVPSAAVDDQLVFVASPSSAGVGQGFPVTPTVAIETSGGQVDAGLTATIQLGLASNPGGGVLSCSGGLQATTDHGVADFTGCSISAAGNGYTLSATALTVSPPTSVSEGVSPAFNVGGTGVTTQLVFVASPTSAGAGQVFPTSPEVAIEDQNGLVQSSTTATITLGIGTNPGGGILFCSGGTSVPTANGIATFTGCSISAIGVGYTLIADASNVNPPTALNEAVSPAFSIGSTSNQLVFIASPTSAGTGAVFPVNPEVAIEDLNGNLLTGEIATIELDLSSNPGGGFLSCSGGQQVTTVNAIATFTGCTISAPGVGYTLLATPISTSPPITLGSAISAPFTVGASAAQLVFTSSPSNVGTGQPFPNTVSVAIEDGSFNVIPTIAATINLGIGTNPGGGILTCSGGLQATTVSGVATFTGCSVSAPGAGYTLVADALTTNPATALNEAVSVPFTVGGASSQLTLTTSKSVITLGDSVTLDVSFGTSGATRSVEIDASPDQATWSAIGTVTTDSNGNASLDRTPSSNAWYRAVFAGAIDLQAATSGTVRVVVRQIALLRPTVPESGKTISKGTSITFTTTVRPIGPSLPVANVTFVLYHWNGSSWVLASTKTEAIDSSGRATWTWNANSAGHWYVRTIADPTTANANSVWSVVQKYTV